MNYFYRELVDWLMQARTTKQGELRAKQETERQARVRALRGKYAFTRTSSEKFAERKRTELEFEEIESNLPLK